MSTLAQRPAIDTLSNVRALLADPEHWTTGTYAKTADGMHVNARSPAAACWCLQGAIQKCSFAVGPLLAAQDALELRIHHIPTFNDTHTHPEVLALLDATLADLQKEPST